MDYQEIDRVAKEFENKLIEGEEPNLNAEIRSVQASIRRIEAAEDGEQISVPVKTDETTEVQNEISELENRIDNEKEETEVPESPLSASTRRMARKLFRMAKQVKESNLDEKSKKAYLAKIRKASEKLGISKAELNRNLVGDPAQIMKKVNEINKITKMEVISNTPIRELIVEMGESFPMSIIGKPLGNCTASEIIKLGPILASLINKYEMSKYNKI